MTRRDPRRFDSFCQHLVRYLSLLNTRSAVAQLVERVAVNHQVTGSSPVRGARLSTATFGGWPFFSQSGGPLIPPAAGPSATSQVEAKRRCRLRRYSSPVRGARLSTATFSGWPFFSQSGGPLIPRSAGPSATSQVEAKRRCRPRRYSSPVRGASLVTATFSRWPFFSQSGGPLIPRSAGPSATSQVEAKRRCRPQGYSSPVRGARHRTPAKLRSCG